MEAIGADAGRHVAEVTLDALAKATEQCSERATLALVCVVVVTREPGDQLRTSVAIE